MAPIDHSAPTGQEDWNETYVRLVEYLNTYALGDQSQVSRLAVELLDQAQGIYATNKALKPTPLTIKLCQDRVSDWLSSNLPEQGLPHAQVITSGCIAFLLSGISRSAPKTFLAPRLPDDLQRSLRQTLLTTGPDLNVSSMTPRHLDYGPMLDLARQTWHRWDGKSILIALAFWAAVYTALYWGITELL